MSTGYEPLLRSSTCNEQMKMVPSLSSGSDVSDLIVLETGTKSMVRRESGRSRVGRSTSRSTATTKAFARAAPKSSPAVIQIPIEILPGGVRKQSPSASSSDPMLLVALPHNPSLGKRRAGGAAPPCPSPKRHPSLGLSAGGPALTMRAAASFPQAPLQAARTPCCWLLSPTTLP